MLTELAQKQKCEGVVFCWEESESIVRQALTARRVEQRLLGLFREGKLFGTIHTCIGQEFSGISVARQLTREDWVFSNHRCHGHYLSVTDDVEGLIGELMGRSSGVCSGLGGSQHLHNGRFFSSGIQGGLAPIAAGVALAEKLEETGGLAVIFIGDGTLGQGVVYESLNIISKWKLPVLIVLENNGWAQSTPQSQALAGSIVDRFAAFGIEPSYSDTWQWQELLTDIERSVAAVRRTGRAHFHQIDMYRLEAHSKGDDTRCAKDVEHYRRCDPLNHILEEYRDDSRLIQMQEEIDQRIERAVEAAQKCHFVRQKPARSQVKAAVWRDCVFESEKAADSIRRGLHDAMERYGDMMLLGEDIEGPYGGAFKVTGDLSERFVGRVRNTPISEAALAGVGNGLALAGKRAVIEIMFGDFMTLAADQWINQASKLSTMYDPPMSMPVIYRTPMGGRRGYGATHSQCLEKHFLGVPGTQVLCLHHRYSPYTLYMTLLETIDRPTLVIENKVLYGQRVESKAPVGYELLCTDEAFGWVRLKPSASPDVTIVAIGGIGMEAEKAMVVLFEEHDVIGELFLPTRLYPLDVSALKESVKHSGRLLVVEEGQGFVSVSSEIVAQVSERWACVRCGRVSAREGSIPAARPLEQFHLPDAFSIVTKALELMDGTEH